MRAVFVIGIFKSLERKFYADCARNGLWSKGVLADIGSKGSLTLLPFENDAIHALRAYLDALEHYAEAHVVVFPYAPIPPELEDELDALLEVGGTVFRSINGQDGWPFLASKNKRPDTSFINSAYSRLWQGMPVVVQEEESAPSEYFRQVADANPQILVSPDVFTTCDLVAAYRREFMMRAIDALVEYVANGSGGRIDAFYRKRGLNHAQTGGIDVTLEVIADGKTIYRETTCAHLKQGDKTTPEGAARLYYQVFTIASSTYAAILYAGAHPDRNTSWVCQLPAQNSHS